MVYTVVLQQGRRRVWESRHAVGAAERDREKDGQRDRRWDRQRARSTDVQKRDPWCMIQDKGRRGPRNVNTSESR